MSYKQPEPVQVIKERRDAALSALVTSLPYVQFLGVEFERRGDELTAIMPYKEVLVGNPMLPALHGGAVAAFLEISAIIELSWSGLWGDVETGEISVDDLTSGQAITLPKTIDFSVDYLRSGLPRDAYARARVNRSGRRYASVHVEAWQDNKSRLFAQATGHFLMPERS
jgi:acyl-coenzyme A thioesterase PaaI-like protein